MTVCHRRVYACHICTCVSRECMDPARLSRTIVGSPDPLIPLIASRVYRIVRVKNLNLSIIELNVFKLVHYAL